MSDNLPAVRRARIERLYIYEISETELAELERGSPDSLLLNLAIFFLSTFISFAIALMTSTVSSVRLFIVLVVVCVVAFGVGLVLISLWLWHRKSQENIFATIRRRMPPDGIPLVDQEP